MWLYSVFIVLILQVEGFKTPSCLKFKRLSSLKAFETVPIEVYEGLAASITAVGLFRFGVYWRMQYVAANMFGRIPQRSVVAEVDAQDGKSKDFQV